jgi:nicotinic acid mononucleotide adenylyltransferase
VQVSTIVISKLSIHIDSVPYNFQEIEIVVLDCHKLSMEQTTIRYEMRKERDVNYLVAMDFHM